MYSWENKEQKNNIELLRLSGELKQQSEETKNLIYPGFGRCMELSKQPSYFGDEPDLLFKSAQGRNSLFSTCNGAAAASAAAPATAAATATAIPLSINATAKINLETSLNDCESGYVPTVGRWGAEWPS